MSLQAGTTFGTYDVDVDGTRFLMIEDDKDLVLPTEIRVVLNWREELEQLAAEAE